MPTSDSALSTSGLLACTRGWLIVSKSTVAVLDVSHKELLRLTIRAPVARARARPVCRVSVVRLARGRARRHRVRRAVAAVVAAVRGIRKVRRRRRDHARAQRHEESPAHNHLRRQDVRRRVAVAGWAAADTAAVAIATANAAAARTASR